MQQQYGIKVVYRNYRGEVATRTLSPEYVWYGTTDWHPKEGYLLHAYDHDKQAYRDFALADCDFVGANHEPTAPHAEIARLTAERDQALARAAAAAMEMRERAVEYLKSKIDDKAWIKSGFAGQWAQELNALPIDPDTQKALDNLLQAAVLHGFLRSSEGLNGEYVGDKYNHDTEKVGKNIACDYVQRRNQHGEAAQAGHQQAAGQAGTSSY